MFGLGMTELLIILAIVLLIFGPKRLKNIGADLGGAIKGFRKAVTDEEEGTAQAKPAEKVIEGEAASSAKRAEGSDAEQNSKV
jgi:sec-independent protein translocase protein TatA